MKRTTRSAARLGTLVSALLALLAPLAPIARPATVSADGCQFVLGFQTLHDALPGVVGDCVDDQAYAANGDAVQHTTGGLLVWRKADNWTAFTDGFHTWINGPNGIQQRLNSERFPWEGSGPGSSGDYLVFNANPQRTGVNAAETTITSSNVGGLHKAWSAKLDDTADSSPIYLSGIATADGSVHDLVYVTTKRGVTYALDAHSGQQVWKAAPTTGQLRNYQITTSTPAADSSRQWIYAASPDGKVHRYAAGSGQESTGGGWPVTATLMPDVEKISSALNVANGYLYVTTSGYNGDFGPYDGHLVALNLSTMQMGVFNTLCADVHQLIGRPNGAASGDSNTCGVRESGVWARSGAVVDTSGGPTNGVVYIASGNGLYDGARHFGDSVLAISPDAMTLFGSYTPKNFQELDDRDIDLGSTAPVLLAQQPNSSTPWMAATSGKDGILRLLDRAHMGGLGSDLSDLSLGIGGVLPALATWQDGSGVTWIFAAANGVAGVQVVTDGGGHSSLKKLWNVGGGATSPVIAGNVLFYAGHDGKLHGLDPATGKELWNSGGNGVSNIHWESPIVTAGMLFISDESGRVTAYGL